MKVEKSHHLPLSWRTRKAGGLVLVPPKGPRTKGVDGVGFSPSPNV